MKSSRGEDHNKHLDVMSAGFEEEQHSEYSEDEYYQQIESEQRKSK